MTHGKTVGTPPVLNLSVLNPPVVWETPKKATVGNFLFGAKNWVVRNFTPFRSAPSAALVAKALKIGDEKQNSLHYILKSWSRRGDIESQRRLKDIGFVKTDIQKIARAVRLWKSSSCRIRVGGWRKSHFLKSIENDKKLAQLKQTAVTKKYLPAQRLAGESARYSNFSSYSTGGVETKDTRDSMVLQPQPYLGSRKYSNPDKEYIKQNSPDHNSVGENFGGSNVERKKSVDIEGVRNWMKITPDTHTEGHSNSPQRELVGDSAAKTDEDVMELDAIIERGTKDGQEKIYNKLKHNMAAFADEIGAIESLGWRYINKLSEIESAEDLKNFSSEARTSLEKQAKYTYAALQDMRINNSQKFALIAQLEEQHRDLISAAKCFEKVAELSQEIFAMMVSERQQLAQ